MTLTDAPARRRALTDLGATLLVEAAAGTGKTSIMAGRAAMLLADGRQPRDLAAITFTELAAGELSVRIRQLVAALLSGEVPRVLELALPTGLSPAQRASLELSAESLDELTTTTIHGFCQRLIQAYSVEADLDPGAVVMAAAQADGMFETVFMRWIQRRLSDEDAVADPVAVLAADDPLSVIDTLRDLAHLRRKHPSARVPPRQDELRPDIDFCQAVDDFSRWRLAAPTEPKTAAIVEQLQMVSAFFGDSLAGRPGFERLWQLSKPPLQPLMKRNGLAWKVYACKTAWRKVAAGQDPEALNNAAQAHYDACRRAFEILLGHIAGGLVEQLSEGLDEVLSDFSEEKRAAAVLDFDDLLVRARRLVREHEPVRTALGERYRHIFVDEFQDTDPVQAEIIFNIAAAQRPDVWSAATLRPSSLFLVGDPKQAIYRFRGADVSAYQAVREAFNEADPQSILQITANFRSAPGIIDHVNSCFEAALNKPGQPGYVALTSTLSAPAGGHPCAVKVTVSVPPDTKAPDQRDAEADVVATLCRRLIGAVQVRRDDGSQTLLRPGDIALLAPTGTELWRYERALEEVRLSVASQAGRALMRRQETQDVVSLVRTLADPFDTLAFGAFMRGPLVGLTENQFLSIANGLPEDSGQRLPTFTVATPPELVCDPVAREVLIILQDLRRAAAGLTPMALLAQAFERLNVRVALTLRTGNRNARALANLEALLEWARPYGTRGLEAFSGDFDAAWKQGDRVTEGRSDESDDAVAVVTVHSSKGLEWPVVIPINTSTRLRGPDQFVHRQSDDTLHWLIGGVAPPELETAQAEEAQNASLERERLWYVACTRARDLLIVPHLPHADGTTWSRVVDMGHERLPELDQSALRPAGLPQPHASPNAQTAEDFTREAALVAQAAPAIIWRQPSAHDPDRALHLETAASAPEELTLPDPVGAGRIRGVLLHKLMEELIGRELVDEPAPVSSRATELRDQLAALEELRQDELPEASECAATALATLAMPEIAEMRSRMVAELPLYGSDAAGVLIAGRADAVVLENGLIDVVVDWKSDVNPSASERAGYVGQLTDYLQVTGARKGAIVYMTRGEIAWVEPPRGGA